MHLVLLILGVVTLIYLLVTLVEFVIGFRQINNLTQQAALSPADLPSVSIIFSALNEENDLQIALESLLNLSHPHMEIIAVNDRSTDGTASILDQMKLQHPALKVLHIQALPTNWLGKNHALHVAAGMATGDWLLFTDADVRMSNPVIAKALTYAIEHDLAHLTIHEYHPIKDFWRSILLLGTHIGYCLDVKPWRVRKRWSKKYLGHGAFNLVNKKAYQASGGHEAIAMECLDDMQLGKLIKSHGYRQDIVDGRDYVERDWYSSFKEMLHGLKKNGFAHFDFRLAAFLRDFVFANLFLIWPVIAAMLFTGPVQWVNVANVIVTIALSTLVASHYRLPKQLAVFYPLAILLLFYTLIGSVISTYKHNGVIWRDTYYSLNSLRNKNRMKENLNAK